MNKKASEDQEDNLAWEDFTKTIKKIDTDEKISYHEIKPIQINNDITYFQIETNKNLDDLEIGSLDNIDRSTAKKFNRHEYRIEAELDLHGYTEKKAFDAVTSFIKKSYLQEKRCVIIVTGKGLRKEEDDIFSSRGVLKDKVPQWLNSEDLRPFILSIKHPSPSLGGTGALYILLKRNK
ncbi:MAG: Smr/MutS family protein [Alphaproteobacteria bacterium]|nr:Smr/MutS family protein [Alphaproteobacteria bacterium]